MAVVFPCILDVGSSEEVHRCTVVQKSKIVAQEPWSFKILVRKQRMTLKI